MKVGVFRSGEGAQDFYRATLPFLRAAQKKEITTSEIWAANFLQEASARTPKFFDTMSSDIYLVQRLGAKSFLQKIKSFLKEIDLKTKIVIDHDDDPFNVSPMSNHYSKYGTKELKIINKGEVIYEWKHGVNMDIDENLRVMEEFKDTIREADMVTVTTEDLGRVFKSYNPNVKVLPNCVDLKEWNKLRIVRDNPKEIRIAWYGGNSHWEDLFLIREALKEIAEKYPNVKILTIGYKPVGFEKDYRLGQTEFEEWREIPAHPYRLAALDIDIGVIPLGVTPFNNAKSPIKWIEFSALQVPCVVSYVTPYRQIADLDNGENAIFIENNNKEKWKEGIEMLINSVQLRQSLGERARGIVKKHFDIETQYRQWIEAYKEVLNGRAIESIVG